MLQRAKTVGADPHGDEQDQTFEQRLVKLAGVAWDLEFIARKDHAPG